MAKQDRNAAADRAASAARTVQGLEAEIAALRLLLDERENSEQAAADNAERDAALAERDARAAHIPDAYAAAAGALVALAQEIMASDARLRARGHGTEMSAEAIARA